MCTLLTQKFCLMCNMQTLGLGGNQIGDAGMKSLADALGKGALPALEVLQLDKNQIGDAGMSAFASACASGALDHLRDLYLANNKFSQQSKDILKTAASKTNCSIHF